MANVADTKQKIDYGSMRITVLFRMLFFPTFLGFLSNSLLNVADGIFVGNGVGSDALAAINIVAPMFLLSAGIGLMFGIGTSVRGGILLAQKRIHEGNVNMTRSFVVAAGFMALFIGACIVFADPLLRFLGCSDRLYDYGRVYLMTLFPGLVFLMLQLVGMMLIRLDGSPKYAMLCNMIPAALNIFLDWLFIFPFGMGIFGAALATSICCVLGGLMVILYFSKISYNIRFTKLPVTRKSVVTGIRSIAEILKLGFSAFIGEIAIAVLMFTGNYVFMTRLGEDGVAAFSVACYLFPVMFMINNSVAQSAQPIMSFNYGASLSARVSAALKVSLGAGIAGGVITSVALWFFGGAVVSLFLAKGSNAYSIAAEGIGVFGLCAIFFAANIAFIGFFQSVERAYRAAVYTLLRGIIFLVPAFLLLPRVFGTEGIWMSLPVAELLTLMLIISDFTINRRRFFIPINIKNE